MRVSAGGPPSGVVTFLFTDIEGSTRRWEEDAGVMRAALAAHDEVLRTAIEAHDGFLFSHTGNGVVAAFASPRAAVDAAAAAQQKLELPVRMGIATGEAELRNGDYFGTVLSRAARVMAAGRGGQILVADSTAVLLSGVDLIDLGPRRLRDLPRPITVHQLRVPALQTDFPPLRTLDSTLGCLRRPVSSLVGRDAEVGQIEKALRAHRLVTLTGVGGVGKTRLALEVASHLSAEFPDGVSVFELAAVADPAVVPDAVAAVLGITQQPDKTVSEWVAAALEGSCAMNAFRRGLAIAQAGGIRFTESQLALVLARLEAIHGEAGAALDHLYLPIRNYHDSGNATMMRSPLAIMVAFLDRLGRHEPAAVIAGFAFNPFTSVTVPELASAIPHLRDVLGDQAYESLAAEGKAISPAELVDYAYDQIDQARTALEHTP